MQHRALQDLIDAAGNNDVGARIISQSTDGPELVRIKALIRNAAVLSSEPSDFIKSKPEFWLIIFSAFRKVFIKYAFNAVRNPSIREACVTYFSNGTPDFKLLYEEAAQAIEDAKNYTPTVRAHYRSQGKQDVLDKALSELNDDSDFDDEPPTHVNGTAATTVNGTIARPASALTSSGSTQIAHQGPNGHVAHDEDAKSVTASSVSPQIDGQGPNGHVATSDGAENVTASVTTSVITTVTTPGERQGFFVLHVYDKDGQSQYHRQMETPIQDNIDAELHIRMGDTYHGHEDLSNPAMLISALTSVATALIDGKQEFHPSSGDISTSQPQQDVDNGASDDSEL